jgi:predicted nucleotidyltransferase
MSTNQLNYISKYNKENYKMYQFRVKRSESELIDKLDNVSNRNGYITNLILEDIRPSVLTIKQIKERIKPVMERHGVKNVYLFGSYARGEANSNSDVDIYCDRGDVDTLFKAVAFNDELEKALGKKVDVVTIGSRMDDFFRQQLEEDMIKICWGNQIDTNLG